jgi:N-acetyl sugar amidotransferase
MKYAKWGAPKNVQLCTKCVISNQRPSSVIEYENGEKEIKPTIVFNKDGVCSACTYHEKKYNSIDWNKREKELIALCDKYRKTDGSYDVLVPASGGKDSIYVAHILKYKYGMNPLTVTWAPHAYTDIGRENFENMIAEFDNILVTPNSNVHRKMTQLSFKNLLHPFQPFMIGQKNLAPKIAIEKDIKFIMYGENTVEGGSLMDANDPLMPAHFFAKPESKIKDISLGGVPYKDLINHGINEKDLNIYLPVSLEKFKEKKVEVHYMSYYRLWDPQEHYYYASENCNFQSNNERSEGTYSKYASLDDKIDGFHYYTTYIKYGLGRCSYDASQEVRNRHITREEAVALVRKFDGEFPEKHFKFFLDYIDIEEKEFFDIINKSRSPHLWENKGENYVLKNKLI